MRIRQWQRKGLVAVSSAAMALAAFAPLHTTLAAVPAFSRAVTVISNGLVNPPKNIPPLTIEGVTCSNNGCSSPCWQSADGGWGPVSLASLNTGCLDLYVKEFDYARATEGIGPLVLPSNYQQLTPAQRLFVLSNLERTARGLPPFVGLTSSANAAAEQGAAAGDDPTTGLGIWAGNNYTALGAVYDWVYDDGYGSGNLACQGNTTWGCWGHRDAILLIGQSFYDGVGESNVYDGAALALDANGLSRSWTEAIFPTAGSLGDMYTQAFGHNPQDVVFSWSQELPYLPLCEQGEADTCPTEMPVVERGDVLGETVNGQPVPTPSPSPTPTPSGNTSCDAQATTNAVGMAANPNGGYWIAESDGAVVACGGAPALGGVQGDIQTPVVAIVADPAATGYWLVTAGGIVHPFGAAQLLLGKVVLTDETIVGAAATPSGNGLWLVSNNGSVFSFGSAPFEGSVPGVLGPGRSLDQPIVGIAAAPTGTGYWLVAADGGVFSFGSAPFEGSVPGVLGPRAEHLAAPVVGGAAPSQGDGYWMVGADGGVFSFGSALFEGSAA